MTGSEEGAGRTTTRRVRGRQRPRSRSYGEHSSGRADWIFPLRPESVASCNFHQLLASLIGADVQTQSTGRSGSAMAVRSPNSS